jgi:hypothetical protein
LRLQNSLEAESALATLYNNWPPHGNSSLFFFLIVFTFDLICAWKTGVHLWIPGQEAISLIFEITRSIA